MVWCYASVVIVSLYRTLTILQSVENLTLQLYHEPWKWDLVFGYDSSVSWAILMIFLDFRNVITVPHCMSWNFTSQSNFLELNMLSSLENILMKNLCECRRFLSKDWQRVFQQALEKMNLGLVFVSVVNNSFNWTQSAMVISNCWVTISWCAVWCSYDVTEPSSK